MNFVWFYGKKAGDFNGCLSFFRSISCSFEWVSDGEYGVKRGFFLDEQYCKGFNWLASFCNGAWNLFCIEAERRGSPCRKFGYCRRLFFVGVDFQKTD